MNESRVYNYNKTFEKPDFVDILKLAKNGDETAFGRLYDFYFVKIYRFIYFRTSHKETAEDLAEEVFLKAFSGIKSLASENAFEGWLYQIARNLVIDHYRKQKATIPLETVENTEKYESNAIDLLNLEQDQKILLQLIKNLSPEEQTLLKMKFFENLENGIISKILNKSEGAIRVMQHRAITKLKQFLKDHEAGRNS